MQGLWLLCSAFHQILIDIHMKFLENILNGFEVPALTQCYDGHISKGNNYKYK